MDRNPPDDTRPAANQPIDVIRDANMKATIWRNEAERGPFYATTFSRSFRDERGEYHDTHSFVAADLLKLSELARRAYHRTTELRREDREQARQSGNGRADFERSREASRPAGPSRAR